MKYTFIKKFVVECEIEVNADTLAEAREIAKDSVWCNTKVSNDPTITFSEENNDTYTRAIEVVKAPISVVEGMVRLKNYKDYKND